MHENGRIFLVDSFVGNEALAGSVNHLLVVGFYLIVRTISNMRRRAVERRGV